MSSPPQTADTPPPGASPVPIPARADSPVRLRTDSPARMRTDSPVRRRRSTSTVHDPASDSASASTTRPRLSPTLTRSFNPHDPDARERQRTLDVDMAMHMARARSHTVSSPTAAAVSPFHAPPAGDHSPPMQMPLPPRAGSQEQHLPSFAATAEMDLPGFSEQEEREFDAARHGGAMSVPVSELALAMDPPSADPLEMQMPMPESEPYLPMYQQHVSYQSTQALRSDFDFSHMEDFAHQERDRLGLNAPASPPGIRWSDFTLGAKRTLLKTPASPTSPAIDGPAVPGPVDGGGGGLNGDVVADEAGPSNPPPASTSRLRQRKFSQSNKPVSRRTGAGKKMAMFENPGAGMLGAPPEQRNSLGQIPNGLSSFENLPGAAASHMAFHAAAAGAGHDRPYRFSFYSNALSGTIHARSLAELPAEGQSFEDLFTGGATSHSSPSDDAKGGQPGSVADSVVSRLVAQSSRGGSVPPSAGDSKRSPAQLASGFGKPSGSGGSRTAVLDVAETTTWWLDVTAPTEDEMKMLSKVFSIHPLTTEDIMMEETREKIELFRNYYLVSLGCVSRLVGVSDALVN
jgi:magnesium transporter